MEKLVVVSLDEIADRWQIPIAVIKLFITDHDMNPVCPEEWFVNNSILILQEKQKVFEERLFRPILSKSTA